MDNVKPETCYTIRCPKCNDHSTVIFDCNPFFDEDYVYCPRCGEKVER